MSIYDPVQEARSKIKIGDIVTTKISDNSPYTGYRGLVIQVTGNEGYIAGKLLKFPQNPDLFSDNKLGDEINWCMPEWLVPTSAKENTASEAYLSPFSGKWV
tara:strand:- start:130 stop:435 length:306 start_codon:yes stop_codon:yes gene_type:complete